MGLKPMNCPAHILIYKDSRHSYRDLPIRYSEAGLVHRHEPSGALHGLLRVRHITQDDAHIFCTEEQIQEEVVQLPALRLLPLRAVRLRASPRALHASRQADRQRRDVGPRRGGARAARSTREDLEYELNPGDGAFYGPEDRPAHDRLARALLAARHRPARLLDARALRAALHRRRQRGAPPGDDPPRADGLLRALHRDPDRALRRRAAGVAGARAGDRAARLRPLQRVRRERRGEPARRAALARSSTTAASASPARSATRSCARSPTCSSSGSASRARARCRCASTTARSSESMPVKAFLERLAEGYTPPH